MHKTSSFRISLSCSYFALCFYFPHSVSDKNETSIVLITIKRLKCTIVGRVCMVSPELSRGKSQGRAEPQLTELFDFSPALFPEGAPGAEPFTVQSNKCAKQVRAGTAFSKRTCEHWSIAKMPGKGILGEYEETLRDFSPSDTYILNRGWMISNSQKASQEFKILGSLSCHFCFCIPSR